MLEETGATLSSDRRCSLSAETMAGARAIDEGTDQIERGGGSAEAWLCASAICNSSSRERDLSLASFAESRDAVSSGAGTFSGDDDGSSSSSVGSGEL